jgi:hypothetical protein
MISAAELRKIQTENAAARKDQDAVRKEQEAKREAEFKTRFAEAADAYYDVILDEAAAALKHVRDRRLNYKYIMLDHHYLIKDVKGLAYTTLLYGFWDKTKQDFDGSIFEKHEVARPFDRAVAELAKMGYTLENISDRARSKRLMIKLSWGDDEAAAAAPAADNQ